MSKRADIAKAMFIETKEVFKKNLKKYTKAEWKVFMTMKDSKKSQETYDTVGNLKPAENKPEGDPINYGKITDGYTTTVINKTWANGFKVSMEAKEDDKWGLVDMTKTSELARTMMSLRERNSADVWDNVLTDVGADGVAHASNSHPLLNTDAAVNDNLALGAFSFANYDTVVRMFNDWKNQYGEKFETKPDSVLLNIKNQTEAIALLSSNLKPFENTNTKNTIPQLTLKFASYISEILYHFIDSTIDSAIMQKRKGMSPEYDYDKRSTFNFYFNVHERYQTGMINPGFGFISLHDNT
jgi:hypothetical protein